MPLRFRAAVPHYTRHENADTYLYRPPTGGICSLQPDRYGEFASSVRSSERRGRPAILEGERLKVRPPQR